MKQRHVLCSLLSVLLLLLSNPAIAGIRAPGKYSGVVFFDRWGSCILFSGVYLMYISEEAKDQLRAYEGQAIEIDAKEVLQVINPGNGLIKRLTVLGPAHPKHAGYTLEDIKLEAQLIAVNPPYVTISLTVINDSDTAAKISSPEIGFALFAPKSISPSPLSVADGPSTAVITRTDILTGHISTEVKAQDPISYRITDEDRLPDFFTLPPHGSKATRIRFTLPEGSYQFLAGYGGGVHEGYVDTSNPVSFDF